MHTRTHAGPVHLDVLLSSDRVVCRHRCTHQIQCPRAAFPDTGEYSAIIGVIAGVLPGPVSLGALRSVAFFIAEAHAMVWWVQWGPIVA